MRKHVNRKDVQVVEATVVTNSRGSCRSCGGWLIGGGGARGLFGWQTATEDQGEQGKQSEHRECGSEPVQLRGFVFFDDGGRRFGGVGGVLGGRVQVVIPGGGA